MENFKCKKCGCTEVEYKKVPPHTGAYCKQCGKWIKWVPLSFPCRHGAKLIFIDDMPPRDCTCDEVTTLLNGDMIDVNNKPKIDFIPQAKLTFDDTPPWEDDDVCGNVEKIKNRTDK